MKKVPDTFVFSVPLLLKGPLGRPYNYRGRVGNPRHPLALHF
jgi:hypothetical protein